MSPIKHFTLTYETLNAKGIFSEGDVITGTVTLSLSKDTRVKEVFVKVKGDANVKWSEGSGDDSTTYSAHIRYFKLKEYLITENAKGTVVSKGVHHFNFSLQIPHGDMPSSFSGIHGNIVYMLQAKVSRSWRWPKTTETKINFLSKSLLHFEQHAVCPQAGSVEKKMGFISTSVVRLSATINRKVCSPGDNFSVVATIHNASTKTMKPKFSLEQKTVYRAGSATTTSVKKLCKIVGDPIPSNSDETVSCQMNIPASAIYTLDNCDILSVEYYVKVYLDISFAFDPEVVFPLVVVPATFTQLELGEAVRPDWQNPPAATGGPSYSDFPLSVENVKLT